LDACTAQLKLNYTGFESNYKPPNTTNFALVLKTAETYDLKVYLKLITGYEILIWNHEYKSKEGRIHK